LREQKALQSHRLADNDVGQHAQFFERFEGKVLRLVNNEQCTSTVLLLGEDEIGDALQQRSLGQSLFGDAESGCDQVQKIISGELCRDYLGDCEIALTDCRQQVVHENGFAGTDLSGDDDEASPWCSP
jgi:hypothetical protein